MDATLRFVELVNGPSTTIDLIEGWVLFDAHVDNSVDTGGLRQQVDDLAARCSEPTLEAITQVLFGELGFQGDGDNYYSPQNSLLSGVLQRRRGLPISLAALLIEVGTRLNVPLDGVGMPGHFLVQDRARPDVLVDPFAGGTLLTQADCKRIFHRLAAPGTPFLAHYLDPVSSVQMLCRMAANLVNAYRRSDDRHNLRWAARLRSHCPGVTPEEHIQLAEALLYTGAFDEAGTLYRAASELVEPAHRPNVLDMARQAFAKLN